MRLLTLIGGMLGAGLTVWLLHRFGFAQVLALLASTGWGLPAVIGFHLVQLLCSAAAWRAIAGDGRAGDPPTPSLAAFTLLRWIREGVSSLLPVAQVGGEFVAVRLLARGGTGLGRMTLARAAACTVGDLTVELVTQILFTVLGLVTLLALLGPSRVTDEVVSGLGIAILAAVAFVASQWLGLPGLLERGAIRLARRFGWRGMGEIAGLDQAITGLYRAPRNMLRALASQMAAWTLGTVEIAIALHALGQHTGLAECLVIESLSQAVKAVGFAVPGSLGVLEGGFVVVGGLFGMPPSLSIALALIRRLREIALGLPALAAWQWLEHRVLLPGRAHAPARIG